MPKLIIADRWLEQLCRSQGIRYEHTSRVIIDAQAGSAIVMYVTQFGDAGLLELTAPEIVEPEITERDSDTA